MKNVRLCNISGGKQGVLWEMCKWWMPKNHNCSAAKPFLVSSTDRCVMATRANSTKLSFICMRMKNDFHIKGWRPTLLLKQRPRGTRKWPIAAKFGLKVDLWIISCKFLKFIVRVLSFIVSSLGVLLSSVAKSIYNKAQIERTLSYFEKVWISLEYKINMELIKAVKPSANSFVWKFNKK